MALKFHKVTALPATLEADALYFVQNNNYAETYVTNSTGVAKSVGNSAMIAAIADARIAADNAAASVNAVEIVADIAARNTMTAAANRNLLILVTNATGDPSVASGAALYAWNETAGTVTKLSEYESMDVVLQWANIQGKPTSSVTLIDDAVSKRHTHANLTQLDKIGESGGVMTYGGTPVGTNWSTTNW